MSVDYQFEVSKLYDFTSVYSILGLDYSKKLISFVTKTLKQKFGSDDFVKKMGQII